MGNAVMTSRQAAELDHAFERNGWTSADVKKMSEGETLAPLLSVINGFAEVNHIIDCDVDPYIPDGWKVEEHKKGGQFEWNPRKIELYLSPSQKDGKYINGNKFYKELEDEPVLNANVLDYFLANPRLIPEEWKKDSNCNIRHIFFWGTIYRHSDGSLCVRYLCWDDGRWYWRYRWLGLGWLAGDPSALLAS